LKPHTATAARFFTTCVRPRTARWPAAARPQGRSCDDKCLIFKKLCGWRGAPKRALGPWTTPGSRNSHVVEKLEGIRTGCATQVTPLDPKSPTATAIACSQSPSAPPEPAAGFSETLTARRSLRPSEGRIPDPEGRGATRTSVPLLSKLGSYVCKTVLPKWNTSYNVLSCKGNWRSIGRGEPSGVRSSTTTGSRDSVRCRN